MSHFLLSHELDLPRRICDALSLSRERGAKRPLADVGVSIFDNTTINCSHYLIL